MREFGRLMTAMVTPFNDSGEIDFEHVEKLVEHLLDTGTETIVVAGTTGESPTLSKEEKIALFQFVVEKVNGRGKVIAGTGTNNTRYSMALTREAEKAGVDGVMLVNPYYNKPSQEGLYQHFKAIAEETSLPVMLYNIPGRTAVNATSETILRLAEDVSNIKSVKEASGDLTQMAQIIEHTPEDFLLYSGDDKFTIHVLAIGGDGVVSVASHIVGREMKRMIEAFVTGNITEAASIHRKLLPFFEELFRAPSPVPVKTALNLTGVSVGTVRLPMIPLNEQEEQRLRNVLSSLGL
ncbi:MAG: 4-hydroxy-tetrahydrodipicolinate synthase [Bacillaceae bacterium]|nr:4-hydroxy-tetrahydrodipicolinate synthase [Bacillaceae bacterium]